MFDNEINTATIFSPTLLSLYWHIFNFEVHLHYFILQAKEVKQANFSATEQIFTISTQAKIIIERARPALQLYCKFFMSLLYRVSWS